MLLASLNSSGTPIYKEIQKPGTFSSSFKHLIIMQNTFEFKGIYADNKEIQNPVGHIFRRFSIYKSLYNNERVTTEHLFT